MNCTVPKVKINYVAKPIYALDRIFTENYCFVRSNHLMKILFKTRTVHIMNSAIHRDLNDIFFFTRVVAAGSFTAAGNELGVPNSTVSRRVSRLEKRLGARLLQRTTRSLSLTEAGELYYERGVAAIASLDEAENLIAESHATPRGRVKVVAPVEGNITADLVVDFLQVYPEVRVDLEFNSRNINIIHDGFDVCIRPGPITNLSVAARKLMNSTIVMVASPSYLNENGTPTRISHLAEHSCIVFGSASSQGYWNLRSGGQERRIPISGRIAVNHMEAVRRAAIAGLGIALLPRLNCLADLKSKRLQPILKTAVPPPVPIYICFAAGCFITPAVRAFVNYIVENFSRIAMRRMNQRDS